MFSGLVSLIVVRDVGGTLFGGGMGRLLALAMAAFGLLLLWPAMVLRMRGAQCVLASVLLSGGLLTTCSLLTYPADADDPSQSLILSPDIDDLGITLVVCMGLCLFVTLNSARSRRWLRSRWWPGKASAFARLYLGLATSLLLVGWAAQLHMHHVIGLNIFPLSSVQIWATQCVLVGIHLLGIGWALRIQAAWRVLMAALLTALALCIAAWMMPPPPAALPLSDVDWALVFAPTPRQLTFMLSCNITLLVLVALSALPYRQLWRAWLWRQKRQ